MSSTGTEGRAAFRGRPSGENGLVDAQQEKQAHAMNGAVEARGRLGRRWPLVALVAGVLGVVLGLLIGWLV